MNRLKFLVTDPVVRKVFPFCNRLRNADKIISFPRKRGRRQDKKEQQVRVI